MMGVRLGKMIDKCKTFYLYFFLAFGLGFLLKIFLLNLVYRFLSIFFNEVIMPLDDGTKSLASIALAITAVVCPPAAALAIGAIGVVAAGNLTTAAVNNDYKKLEEGLEKVEILLAVHPSQTLSE